MPAKKAAKKAASPAPAKKAAKKAASPAKKAPATKAAKKAAPKAAETAPGQTKPTDVQLAAYLNYRNRLAKGEPGDSLGDWLAAENSRQG